MTIENAAPAAVIDVPDLAQLLGCQVDGWHIAGPVWAVHSPIKPRPWLLLQFTENGGHRQIDGVSYLSRRAAVRAYWARRKLGCP
jgi:hypothetical protein